MDEQQAEHAEQHATRASDPDIYLRQMCRMLESQQEAAQVMGANKFQQLIREDVTAALGANVLPSLVSMMKADQMQTRAAAAGTLALLATTPTGRDAARIAGALPLLVLLLEEGPHSPAAEHAAKALMNAAVSDVGKDTIRRNGGVPSLLQLLAQGSEAGLKQQHTYWDCSSAVTVVPAAVHAVGAISNLLQTQCKKVSSTMQKVGGLHTLDTVAAKHHDNVLGARALLAASMLRMQLEADDLLTPSKQHAVTIPAPSMAAAASAHCKPAVADEGSQQLVDCSSADPAVWQAAAAAAADATTAAPNVGQLKKVQSAEFPIAEQLVEQLGAATARSARAKAKSKASGQSSAHAVVKEPIHGLADALAGLGSALGVDPVHGTGAVRRLADKGNAAAKQAQKQAAGAAGGKLASKCVPVTNIGSETVKGKGEGEQRALSETASSKWVV